MSPPSQNSRAVCGPLACSSIGGGVSVGCSEGRAHDVGRSSEGRGRSFEEMQLSNLQERRLQLWREHDAVIHQAFDIWAICCEWYSTFRCIFFSGHMSQVRCLSSAARADSHLRCVSLIHWLWSQNFLNASWWLDQTNAVEHTFGHFLVLAVSMFRFLLEAWLLKKSWQNTIKRGMRVFRHCVLMTVATFFNALMVCDNRWKWVYAAIVNHF